jgi:hypothetical protein
VDLNVIDGWSSLDLIHVLDTAAQGYEVASTGMNGLRLEHFHLSGDEIVVGIVQKREGCK